MVNSFLEYPSIVVFQAIIQLLEDFISSFGLLGVELHVQLSLFSLLEFVDFLSDFFIGYEHLFLGTSHFILLPFVHAIFDQ